MLNIDHSYFIDKLYPLQDRVLTSITAQNTGFYLTGGTALARAYLNHRYSDDLDFFTNLNPQFGLWSEQIAFALSRESLWQCKVTLRQQYFVRMFVQAEVELKLEFVNDVPSRVGEVWLHPTLGRLDTLENILANKLTAVMDRRAPKDLADIWALCVGRSLSIPDAIHGAQSKAVGISPVGIASALFSVTYADWEAVRWTTPPDPDQYIRELKTLAESLILVE